jgi:hypothetical protein
MMYAVRQGLGGAASPPFFGRPSQKYVDKFAIGIPMRFFQHFPIVPIRSDENRKSKKLYLSNGLDSKFRSFRSAPMDRFSRSFRSREHKTPADRNGRSELISMAMEK